MRLSFRVDINHSWINGRQTNTQTEPLKRMGIVNIKQIRSYMEVSLSVLELRGQSLNFVIFLTTNSLQLLQLLFELVKLTVNNGQSLGLIRSLLL